MNTYSVVGIPRNVGYVSWCMYLHVPGHYLNLFVMQHAWETGSGDRLGRQARETGSGDRPGRQARETGSGVRLGRQARDYSVECMPCIVHVLLF